MVKMISELKDGEHVSGQFLVRVYMSSVMSFILKEKS